MTTNKHPKYFFLSFMLLLATLSAAYAQFDNNYWMPPVWDSQNNSGKNSPSELLITTAFPRAAVKVTLTDGTVIYDGSVEVGTPEKVSLSTVEGMTQEANTIEIDKGLLVTSDFPVQAVYRITSDNNQCLAPLKGTFGLGKDFWAGSQTRVQQNSWGPNDLHFISVMAVENDTEVTIAAPTGVTMFGGQNTVTITLDKHETYLVRNTTAAGANADNIENNLAGSHVTSDKPITVVSGAQHPRQSQGGPADAGIDQIVPVTSDIFEVIGTEYIVVRGSNVPQNNKPDDVDYIIAVATQDNTQITVEGNSTTTTRTINAGEITDVSLRGGLGTPYYIQSNEKIYLYHVSGLTSQEVGMSAVPAITCTGSQYLEFSKFVGYDNIIHILAPDAALATLEVNDQPYTAFDNTPTTVPGGIGWQTLTFDFPANTDDIKVVSDEFFHLGIIVGQGGTGTYGYLSGFPKKIDVMDPNELLPTTRYLVDSLEQTTTLGHTLTLESCNQRYRITNVYPSANTGNVTFTGDLDDISFDYTAKADYLGNDTIRVDVINQQNVPGTVNLIFHVQGKPVANPDVVTVSEGRSTHRQRKGQRY